MWLLGTEPGSSARVLLTAGPSLPPLIFLYLVFVPYSLPKLVIVHLFFLSLCFLGWEGWHVMASM